MVHRLLRNLAGSAAVLATLAAVAFGLPALDRAVPSSKALMGEQRYEVGGAVTVIPPMGARIDASKTRPGPDRGTVLFLIGAVRYVIVVTPFGGGIGDAAARLRAKIQSTRGYQVTVGETDVRTDSGLTGLSGAYTAPGRSGRYAVFVDDDLAIEVTVSGADLELSRSLEQIQTSVDSITRGTGG